MRSAGTTARPPAARPLLWGSEARRRQGERLPALPPVVRGEQRRPQAHTSFPWTLCQRPPGPGRRHLHLVPGCGRSPSAGLAKKGSGRAGGGDLACGLRDQPGTRIGLGQSESGRPRHCVALYKFPASARFSARFSAPTRTGIPFHDLAAATAHEHGEHNSAAVFCCQRRIDLQALAC